MRFALDYWTGDEIHVELATAADQPVLADTGALASLDIVELNPACDERNKTALLMVDLIESLFGKSTLLKG